MHMPDYYITPQDRKLWKMAAHWIAQNKPNLTGYVDRCAPIMDLLAKAGAADLPEDAPLPAIVWPPPNQQDLDRLRERSRRAESTGSHHFDRELERMKA